MVNVWIEYPSTLAVSLSLARPRSFARSSGVVRLSVMQQSNDHGGYNESGKIRRHRTRALHG
jgi:hypothetical protein